ncbi:succinate dehydrogenase [Rhizocola hellebori]|uniref:Succinate dehydrogenase n=2 Tax=Rhizocola hellebori TaxID=1392758 RepID=A0A8J3VF32_9ACTN|nr:succinate dehydrogenase [Rhizocola hellebori]
MAVTGALLVGFLLAHMAGNLKIFFGSAAFDSYAHWLREIGEPVLPFGGYLWVQRVVLLAAIAGHLWAATALTVAARRARPVRYAHRPPVQGSYAARTMRWGGVIIALFVVYHVLDLTTRDLNPVAEDGSAYAAVAQDFAPGRWYVTAFYTLAVITLGFHLRHGIWSALQTLGLKSSRPAALAVSLLVCAGFLAVPYAATFGVI